MDIIEDDVEDMNLSENAGNESNKSKQNKSLEMTEQEMSQHLSLCLKLAAENKINTKNAFGLHLIDIMRKMVKQNGASDLQAASMSLQASSKIYAGRVEALYKDTFAFHNHLQTIVSNKKVREEKDSEHPAEYDDDEDSEERREKRRSTKSKQTYLTTEESVAFKSELSYSNSNPHANYITVKSAFTSSRTDPKLLDGLTLENDSCRLNCTNAALCFNPQKPASAKDFLFTEKCKNYIKKAQSLRLNLTEYSSGMSSDVFYDASKRTPPLPPPPPELDLTAADSFCIGTTPVHEPPESDNDVQDIIERFSVLDITADLFASEVSQAILLDNTLDRRLLPPNSALKKILNTADKRKKITPTEKVRKEKQPREPFFNPQRVVDRSILNKGRRIELSDNDVSKWQLSDTADLHCGGYEKFSTALAEHIDQADLDANRAVSDVLQKLIQDKIQEYNINGYFCKKLQPWNIFQRQDNICLIRPSSFGVCLGNDGDSVSTSSEANSNAGMVQSFQNLSLHNSGVVFEEDDVCFPPDAPDDLPGDFSPEHPLPYRATRSSGMFEDDLKSVMVTPPELVKPVNMKFQTEPITLNTEKVKNALWHCIEPVESVLLSDVHKQLEVVFEKEKLPIQYVFTMLLLLANEKCLLLENISNGVDVKIMKDIQELDVS